MDAGQRVPGRPRRGGGCDRAWRAGSAVTGRFRAHVGSIVARLPERWRMALNPMAFRYRWSDIPAMTPTPDTPVRLVIGLVNNLGQGWHGAQTVARHPNVGAENHHDRWAAEEPFRAELIRVTHAPSTTWIKESESTASTFDRLDRERAPTYPRASGVPAASGCHTFAAVSTSCSGSSVSAPTRSSRSRRWSPGGLSSPASTIRPRARPPHEWLVPARDPGNS